MLPLAWMSRAGAGMLEEQQEGDGCSALWAMGLPEQLLEELFQLKQELWLASLSCTGTLAQEH